MQGAKIIEGVPVTGLLRRKDRIAGLRHDGLGVWSAELVDGSAQRIGRTYLARVKAMAGR
jgi:two-component system response regulator AlgR